MKKLKKLTAMITLLAPIATVVSCAPSADADNMDITKSAAFRKNGLFVDSDEFHEIKVKSHISLHDFMIANRKLKDGEYVDTAKDVSVLSQPYYSGHVQDISTIYTQHDKYETMAKNTFTTPFQYIGKSAILPTIKGGWGQRAVVEVGANDSLLYFFNKDDNDGKSVRGFKDYYVLEDSSIASQKDITEINKMLGVRTITSKWGSSTMSIPFIGSRDKGVLTSYYGSQNNHNSSASNVPDFLKKADGTAKQGDEKWTAIYQHLSTIYPLAVVKKVIKYYETASKGFQPTEIPFGFVKFQVIGPNCIKVDFSSKPQVTAAHFGWLSKDTKTHKWDAEFSMGGSQEWHAYEKQEIDNKTEPQNYYIIGKH